jgi:hypothetical protein
MSKSQQEYVAKHLKKKDYLQQIQTLVDRINLLHTENKKKYPLKLELIHGFSYEEEEDPEYFFTLREKRNWLKSLNWPKRKITIFFHYREDGDWKKRRKPDPDIEKHIPRFLTKKEKALQDLALQDELKAEFKKYEIPIDKQALKKQEADAKFQASLNKLKEKLQKANKEFQAALNKLKEDFQNERNKQEAECGRMLSDDEMFEEAANKLKEKLQKADKEFLAALNKLKEDFQNERNKQEAECGRMLSDDRDFQGDDEMFEEAVDEQDDEMFEEAVDEQDDEMFEEAVDEQDDGWDWYNGPPCWVENQHVDYPCLVAQIADDFTNLEGFESKYADTDGYLDSTTKALLNGKSIYDWGELNSRYYMNADIDEEEVMDTLKKILMKVTKVDFN